VVTRHTGPSLNDEQQGQQQVQTGTDTTTMNTLSVIGGPRGLATQADTRTRTLRSTVNAIRQHMHTVHHLGASSTS
jgi:hypothetical protein